MFKHANTFEPGDTVRIKSKPGEKTSSDYSDGEVTGFANGQFRVTTKRGEVVFKNADELERV